MVQQVQTLEDLVTSLLDTSTTYYSCDTVVNEIAESLKVIGEHQPSIVLTACYHYLLQNTKVPPANKAFVLKAINVVLSDASLLSTLDEQLVLLIINLATQEMTMTKDADQEWAEAAKDILVSLGRSPVYISHVIDAVLQKFPPGMTTSPHRYVVIAFSTLAQHNPYGLLPFLTDILSRAVPLLQHIKTDPLRSSWARAICSFCEAIRECQTDKPVEAIDHNQSDGSAHELNGTVHDLANKTLYADQSEAIYDVVYYWMSSRDPKTRADAAECIGELCLIIPPKKVIDEIKKLVHTLIGLYKKAYTEQHIITVAVCRFLEATCMDDSFPLEPYLEDILNAVFPNACLDPGDVSVSLNVNSIKNHSEAFRCFHVASVRFADKIVYYLLHKMQNVSDLQKLGAINVLRHLLNSSGQYMEDKRSLVMMGLKKLLAGENTASIKVKRAIVQLCVALADHAYVDADGGEYVISFLVRNLVPPPDTDLQAKKLELDVAGSNQLRTQCAQALQTIAGTCSCANKLLWPYMFEFICVERYSPVLADICKCLRTLMNRELESGKEVDYVTGFDKPQVAGSPAVMARLITSFCNAPLNGLFARRAREALLLFKNLLGWFHRSIVEVGTQRCERLEPLLDELCNSGHCQSPTDSSPSVELRGRKIARWHDACLEMVSAVVSTVVDGNWRQTLVSAFAKQIDLYKEHPEEKSFLLRCMGTVLAKIAGKAFVVEHLMLMFKSTQHSNTVERQGCARAVGAIATVHIDTVLIELENVSKWEHNKKSSSFFGYIMMRNYSDTEMVFLRATLMLSYGYVVLACTLDTVVQRLQNTVSVFLRHYFANTKQETVVREAMLETMRLIAIAVQPQRLGVEYRLDIRNELLSYIKDYVQSETPEMLSSSLRLLAAKASSALVRLQPPLSDAEIKDLSMVLTQYILPMCREKSGLKTLAYDLFDYASQSLSVLSTDATTAGLNLASRKIDDDESATIMEATVTQYGAALESIVFMKPTVNTVTILLKMLQSYYGKTAEHERARAVDATVLILRVYYEYAEDIVLGTANDFAPLASLLARLSPRLADSLAQVRLQSLTAIHWALRLAHIHKGHGREADGTIFSIDDFAREHLAGEGRLDGQAAKRAIRQIANVIESRLPQSQIQVYLSGLFEMLTDRQNQVSSSAAQLLTYILTTRGAMLVSEGETLVSTLVDRLPEVHSCVQTYTDVMASLVAFAGHNMHVVCDVLLRQPLPIGLHPCDAWECLSRDKTLFPSILDYLLELLNNSLEDPFEVMEIGGGSSVKIVHQETCQYTAAITEVVKNGEPEWNLNERVPSLLAALIYQICTVSDTQFPVVQKEGKDGSKHPLIITPELRRAAEKPAGLPVTAIKTILHRLRVVGIIEEMNQARGWTECLDKELFVAALTQLVRSMVEHRPDWIGPLWASVTQMADSEKEPIRLAVVIVASSLIKNSPDVHGEFNEKLLIECIRLLQNELTDQSLRIRKLCVRGLGELADCSCKSVTERFASAAVDAAMGGLDDLGDRKDTVAMESILALSKLVSQTSDTQLLAILPQVLLKIRPCFEKESAPLRAASFSLFGELGERVGEKSGEFINHLQTNVVTILLHLNDDDEDVRKMCALSLHRLHPLFNVALVSKVVDHEMPSGKMPSNYNNAIKDLAAALALSFTDRINQYALTCSNYFKSCSPRIRSNAAALTGHLLVVLTPQLRATISKDLIFSGLVVLLKDPEDVGVRIAATKAVACLHSFS